MITITENGLFRFKKMEEVCRRKTCRPNSKRPRITDHRIHPILSPSCVAENSRSAEGFMVCLERGCTHLQRNHRRAGPDFQAHLRYRHITLLSIVRSCNQRSINCIDDQVLTFPINVPSIGRPSATLEVRLNNNKLAIMIIC